MVQRPEISPSLWLCGPKRAFDLAGAILLLLLLSPVLVLAAAGIKLTSRGPVFFMQDRGGKDGRTFTLYKFRTMRGSRTPDPEELVPLDHPEITRIGWWLRRLKIDELPQLFNVLAGSMSLVGPRPTLLDQVAAYDDFRRQRLLVRPGVTGLAQTHGNTLMPWDERILYDIAYVRRCGLGLDMLILIRTAAVILVGEKAMSRPFATSRYAQYVAPLDGN